MHRYRVGLRRRDHGVPTALVLYFFNPFEIEIFDKVFARILESYKESPCPMLLIYVSGIDEVLERVLDIVLASDRFERARDERLPFFIDAPWRLRCLTFASRAAA